MRTTSASDVADHLIAAHRHAVYGRVGRWLIHDLRNPTQALTLITELMNGQPEAGDPDMVETVREATNRVARSLELLDRLLRVVPTAGEAGPVAVRDSLDFVAALFYTHHSAATLRLDTSAADPLPAVRGLEHELEHVLLTLLLRALDDLEEREGGITLGVRPDESGVAITVSAEEQAELSDEEWDAPSGLAVARRLAARHGGSLARVRENGLARYLLRLPRWAGRAS